MTAIFIIIALIALFISCIKIVPHTESFVVERLGKFHTVWGAGLHLQAPFGIDRIVARATSK